MTSFLALATNLGPFSVLANSTPTALVTSPVWSNMIRVTWAWVATFRLGLLRTSGVRYADSAETRRPFELIYVTAIVEKEMDKSNAAVLTRL